MDNPEHVALLKESVEKWNKWREKNPRIIPDLASANLQKANLQKANLQKANLQKANLQGANLEKSRLLLADLQGTNLRGINLEEANLESANLQKADLQGANLEKANLESANLEEDNLESANLRGSNLRLSNLICANLMNSQDLGKIKLFGTKFGGANLTSATLPKEIDDFKGRLASAEEASKVSRKLYAWLLGGLGFSILTIASRNDPYLLTNTITSPLPIINMPFPFADFFLVAPLALLALFIYFQLQLQHQCRLISNLPAVFSDGIPLHDKLFPWLFNVWAGKFFQQHNKQTYINSLPRDLWVISLVFISTPAVIFLFWGRYLPRHDGGLTWLNLLFLISTFLAGFFFLKVKSILSFQKSEEAHFEKQFEFTNKKRALSKPIYLIIAIFFVYLTSSTSYFITQGNPKQSMAPNKYLIPDFSGRNVSLLPDNWNPDNPTLGVKGANLVEADLKDLKASKSTLIKADLRIARLQGANLMDANLTGANLTGTKLTDADLTGANLMDANLTGANLGGTILKEANLTGANLTAVNLYGVNLYEADLRETKGLSCNQIKSVKSLDNSTQFPNYLEISITGENKWTCKEVNLASRNDVLPQSVYENEPDIKTEQETEGVVR